MHFKAIATKHFKFFFHLFLFMELKNVKELLKKLKPYVILNFFLNLTKSLKLNCKHQLFVIVVAFHSF